MAIYVFSNKGGSTLAADLAIGQTQCTVVDASSFPDLAIGQRFFLVLESTDRQAFEACQVIAINKGTNTLTLLRGQGGTAQANFLAGAYAENRLTKGTLEHFLQRDGDTMDGDFVVTGDTDLQDTKVEGILTLEKDQIMARFYRPSSNLEFGRLIVDDVTGLGPFLQMQAINQVDFRINSEGGNVYIEDIQYPKLSELIPGYPLFFDGVGIKSMDYEEIQNGSLFKWRQPNHGFRKGMSIYVNHITGLWGRADSSNPEFIGVAVVDSIVDQDVFVLRTAGVMSGLDGLPPWKIGRYYYTSPDVPGLLTEDMNDAPYENPMGLALASDLLMVLPFRASRSPILGGFDEITIPDFDPSRPWPNEALCQRESRRRDIYRLIYQNRTGVEIPPGPWDETQWTQIGSFLEDDSEFNVWNYDLNRTYRLSEKVIVPNNAVDQSREPSFDVYICIRDNQTGPWDWDRVLDHPNATGGGIGEYNWVRWGGANDWYMVTKRPNTMDTRNLIVPLDDVVPLSIEQPAGFTRAAHSILVGGGSIWQHTAENERIAYRPDGQRSIYERASDGNYNLFDQQTPPVTRVRLRGDTAEVRVNDEAGNRRVTLRSGSVNDDVAGIGIRRPGNNDSDGGLGSDRDYTATVIGADLANSLDSRLRVEAGMPRPEYQSANPTEDWQIQQIERYFDFYEDTRNYPLGDKVLYETNPGKNDTGIWLSLQYNPAKAWDWADTEEQGGTGWRLISVDTNRRTNDDWWFDPTITYLPGEFVFNNDSERPLWVSMFENQTGADIPPGPWDQTQWTRLQSAYYNPWGKEFSNTGLLTGGFIAVSGALTVDVNAGVGQIIDQNNLIAPNSTRVEWADTTVTVDFATTTALFITVDINGVVGPVNAQSIYPSAVARSAVVLGIVVEDPDTAGQIGTVVPWPVASQSTANTLLEILDFFLEAHFVGGGTILPKAGTMTIERELGTVYAPGANWHNNPNSPNLINIPAEDPMTFRYIDQNGILGAVTSTFDPTQWDDGGTITPVQGQRASIQRIYHSIITGVDYVLWGQDEYDSLTEAINQIPNEDASLVKPGILEYGMVFVGWVVMVGQATDIGDNDDALVKPAGGPIRNGGSQVVEELDGLTDVSLLDRTLDQALVYDGAIWRNQFVNSRSFTPGDEYRPGEIIWAVKPDNRTLVVHVLQAFTAGASIIDHIDNGEVEVQTDSLHTTAYDTAGTFNNILLDTMYVDDQGDPKPILLDEEIVHKFYVDDAIANLPPPIKDVITWTPNTPIAASTFVRGTVGPSTVYLFAPADYTSALLITTDITNGDLIYDDSLKLRDPDGQGNANILLRDSYYEDGLGNPKDLSLGPPQELVHKQYVDDLFASVPFEVQTWVTATQYLADTYLRGTVSGQQVFGWVVNDYTSGATFEADVVAGAILLENNLRLTDPDGQGNANILLRDSYYEDGAGAPKDLSLGPPQELVHKQYVDDAIAAVPFEVQTWVTATAYLADTYLRGTVGASEVFGWVTADYTSGASFEADVINGDITLENTMRLTDPDGQANPNILLRESLYQDGAGNPKVIDVNSDPSELVHKQYVDQNAGGAGTALWQTNTPYVANQYLRGTANGHEVFAWVNADYTSGVSMLADLANGDLTVDGTMRLRDPDLLGNPNVLQRTSVYQDDAGTPRDITLDDELVHKQYVDRQGWIKRNFSSAAGTWQAGDWITIITRETSSVSYQNYVHFVVHTSGTGSNRTQFSGIINVTQGTNQIILNDWFTYNGNAFDAIRFDRTPEVRIQLRAAQNQGGAVSWNIATFDPAPGATNPFVGVQPIVQAAGDGVDVISNLATGQSVASSRIREVTNPVDPQDAATKAYVDANSGGGTVSQGSAALADNATMSARQHVTCFNLNPPATLIGVSCIVDFTFVLDMGNNTGNSAEFWARCNTNSTGNTQQRVTAAVSSDGNGSPVATGAARFSITPTGGTIQVQLRSEASNNVFWRNTNTYGRGHCTITPVTVV